MFDNFYFCFYFFYGTTIFILYAARKQLAAMHYIVALNIALAALLLCTITVAYPTLFLQQGFGAMTENLFSSSFCFPVALSFRVNTLSMVFSTLVLVIGFATNFYILSYFKQEADELSFAFWLNAFIFSMLTLVLAANFFTLFLGWELIGLTSFFLINFWQAKRATLKASFKAFTFNLVSDVLLLTALINFFLKTGTDDCDCFLYCVQWDAGILSQLTVGAGALVLCAAIKSVQLLGHLWLPDSMEAPVPASALIHSATLVSAGIYLLCKFNVLYALLNWEVYLISWGALTAAYGGVVAAAQTDLKKLLAYSTMSHCGLLWILASSHNFWITALYLFLHGLFKASTFYCAGSFIRLFGTQDSRWMGNGHTHAQADSFMLNFAAFNLAGLPFSLGAYYKAFFFKFICFHGVPVLVLGLIFIALCSGLVYYFRLTFYVLYDFDKTVRTPYTQVLTKTRVHITNKTVVQTTTIIAFLILLVTAGFTVIFFLNIIANSGVELLDTTHNASFFFLYAATLQKFYSAYYIYFYFIYGITILTLILFTFRKNSFQLETWTLLIYSVIFFLNVGSYHDRG